MQDEPLFWIHLNVDYPFNLTGILYFPRIKSNIDLQRNKIQLYCNQVFVTDQVEGIVPDFLTLLHGVIDSPDIPLNVSRSYLQSDANVKKISTYITRKVGDKLNQTFKEDRKHFEEIWDDLKLFINYGMLSQPEFYDKAKDFALMKDTEGKYYTFDEYQTLIKDDQTDKDGNLVYLYSTDKDKQYSYIDAAKKKGYNVLLMDGQLDVPMASMLEQKLEKSRFSRVDSDVIDRLIQKQDPTKTDLTTEQRDNLTEAFRSQMPVLDQKNFTVTVESLGADEMPVLVTQNEYMRRMKDMSRFQPGMSFYAQMADAYELVLNADHALVKDVLGKVDEATADALKPIDADMKGQQARLAVLHQEQSKKKPEEITEEEKKDLKDTEAKIDDLRKQRNGIVDNYAKDNKVIHQLIDLALLQNGMLTGQAWNSQAFRAEKQKGQTPFGVCPLIYAVICRLLVA